MHDQIHLPATLLVSAGAGLAIAGAALAGAGTLAVVSVDPVGHSLTAPTGTAITIRFDRAVDPNTIGADDFWMFGRWSGSAAGPLSFSDGDTAVTLQPDQAFSSGEQVMVILSHDVRGADGSAMRPGGYSFQFWTRAQPAPLEFELLDTLSTNSDGESSQPYGGIGSDLNGDGWLDVTIVNEITADLRVFMNEADGTGRLGEFEKTTFPVNSFASPSEAADFDHDGNVDICVANQVSNTVSILLGNGDGTFRPQQEIAVGVLPNGIVVLDADGDGDIDIVNANNGSGNLSILINDGSGVFAAPTFFDAGVAGERALAATDMNGDGLLDLVIGTRNAPTSDVVVMTANGDGTFTFASSRGFPGTIWMLVAADVNDDGAADVTVVSGAFSNQDEGAILLGDGAGGVGTPQTYPLDHWPVATDLGDMDGDGDLDWITSSFAGDWLLFLNDGEGNFTFDQTFDAPLAASCSLAMDLDNDRDLDLVFVDETADLLITYRNSGITPLGDVNGDGVVSFADLLLLLAAWGDCGSCPEDLNGDGTVSFADVLILLSNWS